MSKQWKPGRTAVELRPSRIRREPVRIETKPVPRVSREREAWGVVAGVLLFTAAWAALGFGVSVVTSHGDSAAAAAPDPAAFGHCYNHAGPNCVVDGDTIYLDGAKIEIAGMDAPEIQGAQCPEEARRGVEAAVRLLEMLNSGTVAVTATERGPDGQLLRKVEVDGRSVGAAMTSAGVARGFGVSRNWC